VIEVTIRNGMHGPNLGVFKVIALPNSGDRIAAGERLMTVLYVEHHAVCRNPGEFDLQAPGACIVVEYQQDA